MSCRPLSAATAARTAVLSPSRLRPLTLALHLACASGLLALAGAADEALAQTSAAPAANANAGQPSARRYDIPAGPLADVLTRFSAEAGIFLVGTSELAAGRSSHGVRGSYGVDAALDALLEGSGLTAERNADGHYRLRRLPPEPVTLGTVTVSGKAPGSTTEGTGSYTTGSTSSSTRLNLSLQETPQAITVLTRQRMEDQRLDTLEDAMDAAVGLVVQRSTFGQDGPAVYARGTYLRNYQVDGVPTSSSMSPFLENTAAYDRIEIVRGATGVMNGMGSPAATVNLIRKRPTAGPQVSVSAQAGSWDRYGFGMDASGALNDSGSARGRFVADYSEQGAWADRFEQKKLALYGIGEFDLGDRTLLTLGFSHMNQRTDSPLQGRPLFFSNGQRISLDPSDNTTQRWRYYRHESTGVFASVEHEFDRGWIGKLEYNHTEYKYDGKVASLTGSVDAATGSGTNVLPSRWNSRPTQDNLDGYVTGAFSLFGKTHELIAGFTLSQLRSKGPSYARPGYTTAINFYDWADAAEPVFVETGKSDSRERQHSVFLNARFTVTDATSLLLGGRKVFWKREQESLTYGSGSSESKQKENVFVPYAGVVHALNDVWSVFGSYTKIYRPQDEYISSINGNSEPPEEGEGYELGVKASFFGGRLSSSLSVFQTNVDNLAVWNVDTYRYDVLGGTESRGVELELNGELAPGWQLSAGYAYARVEDQDGERTLNNLPLHNLKLFTSYRLAGALEKLTVGGGLNWQSALGSGTARNYTQGSLAVVNLMARYALSKQLALSLNLNNAFDKRYYSTVANDYGTFAAPRNFVVSAKYSF